MNAGIRKEDRFPARVSKSGSSLVITIPIAIREKYQVGQTVYVTIELIDGE